MADTEYIEITNKDVVDVKKETELLEGVGGSESTDTASGQELEGLAETDPVSKESEDKTNELSDATPKYTEVHDADLNAAQDLGECFLNYSASNGSVAVPLYLRRLCRQK